MSLRNIKGQFIKGNNSTPEEKLKKIKSLIESWKNRKDYIADIKNLHPKIYNSWRAFMFTEKGKKIGCSDEWKNFRVFYNDVINTYKEGLLFRRIDTKKPFSKDNFIWIKKEDISYLQDKYIQLTYKGETLPLHLLADKYKVSVSGIRNRYFKHKNDYTIEQIIFGKTKNRNSKNIKDIKELNLKSEKRAKASKLISSYKIRDKKNCTSICDYTIEDMLEVMNKPCIYCGDTNKVGLDRLDNNKGHTKDNTVPCCYDCNCAKNINFSFDEMKVLGQTIRKIKQSRLNS